MGVNLYLLDRRSANLIVGSSRHTVGTLRRFFKLTEMDSARSAVCEAATRIRPSPAAVINIDVIEMPLADNVGAPVSAHLVLGWDEGRGSVTDLNWDYLPKLGFAVRDRDSGNYILYEEKGNCLHAMNDARAKESCILDAGSNLVRHGQPHIATCQSVRPYIAGYAEAECTFDNGEEVKLLFATPVNMLPPASWLLGKRPMDVERYGDKSL